MKQPPRILRGTPIAQRIMNKLAIQVKQLPVNPPPTLAVVYVGSDPASAVYVRKKQTACKQLGIRSIRIDLPPTTQQNELGKQIKKLNKDPGVHGILVQLPLPAHLNPLEVISLIDPRKDVDCFHPLNVGLLSSGKPSFLPCTPAGIMILLDAYAIPVQGKDSVVIGKSNIVGKPLVQLLLDRRATVTVCHSKTQHLKAHCQRAELLFVAVGKPGIIQPDMVNPEAIVVDVGINRLSNGTLVGDVSPQAQAVARAYTPVPGGVGPMTIAMLMQNIVLAATR